MAMSTRGKSTNNNSNTSQAAESSGSDSYEAKIAAFMAHPFNFSREEAEAHYLSVYGKASRTVVDEPQVVLEFYSKHGGEFINMAKVPLTVNSTVYQFPLIPALVYARPIEENGVRTINISYRVVSQSEASPVVEVVSHDEAGSSSDVDTVELTAFQAEAIMFGVSETEGLTHCPPGYRRQDPSTNGGPAPELYADFQRLQKAIFEACRRIQPEGLKSNKTNVAAIKNNSIATDKAKFLDKKGVSDEKIDEFLKSSEVTPLFNSSSVPDELLVKFHKFVSEINIANLVLCTAVNEDIITQNDAVDVTMFEDTDSNAQPSGSEFFNIGQHGCSRFIQTVRANVGPYPVAVRIRLLRLFQPFISFLSVGRYTVEDSDVQTLAVNNFHQKSLRNFVVKLSKAYSEEFPFLTWLQQWRSHENDWSSGRGLRFRMQDISCYALCISPLGYFANLNSNTMGVNTMNFNNEAGIYALLTFMKRFGINITRPTTMISIIEVYQLSYLVRAKQLEHPLSFMARVRQAVDRVTSSVVTLDPNEMFSSKVLAQLVIEATRVHYGLLDHTDQTWLSELHRINEERRGEGNPLSFEELYSMVEEVNSTNFQITSESSDGSPSTYFWPNDNDEDVVKIEELYSNAASGRSSASRPPASSSKQVDNDVGSKHGNHAKGNRKSGSQNPPKADSPKKNQNKDAVKEFR